MKHILLSTILMGTLSTWSVAQKPQTTVEVLRPVSVETNRPQTVSSAARPTTTAELNRPVTQTGAAYAQTTVQMQRPQTTVFTNPAATTVEVIRPATTAEVIHPQTPEFSSVNGADNAAQKGGKNLAGTSARAATSMSDFKAKQAKDFTAGQKAFPTGGGENKLGNDTNVAEKDAANKASLLSKQGNQNMDVDPKLSNLGGLGKAVEKKVEEKKK